MQVRVLETSIISENFDRARRMLIHVMGILNLKLIRQARLHDPHIKDDCWVWQMITRSNNLKWRIPIYLTINQLTLRATLSVTRKTRKNRQTRFIDLPVDLDSVIKEEAWRDLGFE